MIGRIHGKLLAKQPPQLLVDVGGIGYEIEAPLSTCFNLPEVGHPVTLCTHLTVREDAHILFGFATDNERQLFRSLIKTNGVGPKLALGILSGISADEFICCVQERDITALTRIPGIGRKTAERLTVEMADRLDKLPGVAEIHPGTTKPASAKDEAISALTALGYKTTEVQRLLKGVDDSLSSEELIRQALQSALK